MARTSTRVQLRSREGRGAAKQQLVILVSILAIMFLLCPERLKVYRNLCFVPILASFTAIAFDLAVSLSDAWDNAPRWIKYCVPLTSPDFAPPFDQIRHSLSSQMAIAVPLLQQSFSDMKHRMACFKEAVLLALINWLLGQIGQGPLNSGPSRSEHEIPHPTQEPDQWIGILVATPPVHGYGRADYCPNTAEPLHQAMSWESYDVSSIPAILPPSTFRTHLALCLIPRDIWHSPRKTIMEKFKAGLYWDHQPKNAGCDGLSWPDEKIQWISSVQVIGYLEDHTDIDAVNDYYNSLQRQWNYMNICWNDVDFAIILAFLVVRPVATEICKNLFDQCINLRVEQALRPIRDPLVTAPAGRWCFTVATGVVAVLTGGLALPSAYGILKFAMSAHDAALWEQRMNACRKLSDQYEQLAAILN